MTERERQEQEERQTGTTPSEETKDATTPPGTGDTDEEAVERGQEKLDQAGGAH